MNSQFMVMDCSVTESRLRHIPYEKYKDFTTFNISEIQDQLAIINWRKVHSGGSGGRVTRSSAWFTDAPCSCKYAYGNTVWEPLPFTVWMKSLVADVCELLNITTCKPNSMNCNRYDNFSESLAWHADDEPLFSTADGNITIISMSFGESRNFGFKKSAAQDSDAKYVVLNAGDLLTMEGKMQSFWKHCIPPSSVMSSSAIGSTTRYNITMRYVAQHSKACPC
jgi:alkylated DNA repair dioxygenase AlkB